MHDRALSPIEHGKKEIVVLAKKEEKSIISLLRLLLRYFEAPKGEERIIFPLESFLAFDDSDSLFLFRAKRMETRPYEEEETVYVRR